MLNRILPDKFILLLLLTIAVATVVPAYGQGLALVSAISNAAIFSLFFFHGLRLSHASVLASLTHWRLQAAVLAVTFVMIPLVALALLRALPEMLTPELWMGVLFLAVLPSTVQSAIAYTSMAGGNVAASVIASATSNLSAIFLTPLLFTLVGNLGHASSDMTAIGRIMTLLLLPFLFGQATQRWMGKWAERNRSMIGKLDRTTIVITVYVTFSAAVMEGLWSRIDGAEMLRLTGIAFILLTLAMLGSLALGRALGFATADRTTLFFGGSHKSLATGAPMARILFPAAEAGMIILPLMIYHQLQLMLSAWIAASWAKRNAALDAGREPGLGSGETGAV